MASRTWAFIRLGRPHFLVSGFLIYALGALLARPDGPLDRTAYAWGQAFVTLTQLMVHYGNDAHDLAADRANRTPTAWTGGSRVLVEGTLQRATALAAARVFGTGALLTAAAIVAWRGDALLALLLAATWLLAWAYSAPPPRLQARGLGPIVTAAVVAVLVPVVAFRLQGPAGGAAALQALVPETLLLLAVLVLLDIPDAQGDRAAGKRTCAVLWGPDRCAGLAGLLVGAGFVAGALVGDALVVVGTSPVALALLVLLAAGAARRHATQGAMLFLALALWLLTVAGQVALRA